MKPYLRKIEKVCIINFDNNKVSLQNLRKEDPHIGDMIAHPLHGAVIEDIEEKQLTG